MVTSPRTRPRADAAAGPVLVAVLSVLAAAQALRLWDWRPGVPLSLEGDSPQVLTQIRAIMDGHWYAVNDRVGAPFGMNQAWFTTADLLNFGGIRVLGLFSDSPATVGAIFFLLGFPAAALTAYWLARQLHLTRPAAVLVGVLFSVLPGHQVWFAHLWLAAYWMVPLAVWLVVQTARGDRIWPPRSQLTGTGEVTRAARWQAARTAGIVLAVGLADVYYVAFTLLLLAIVLVVRLFTGTRAVRLLPGAAAAAAIGGLCGLSLVVATRGRAGDPVTGALPAQRVIGESEVYAGKIIELVLPWYEHRVGALRFLSFAYGVAAPPSVERPALGVVALAGVAAILWVSITALALARRVPALWGLLAALTLVSLGFYTRGGLGSLVALFLTPQIRTWSRFVVLIGLFGLIAVGLWVGRLGRRHGRRTAWVGATLLLVLGVLDQTSPGAAPRYADLAARQAELTAYGHEVADRLGGDCSVFQLPVVSFPEEPAPGEMGDYDHLLPSLASPAGLTWSYGAIRGTASADWQLALPVGDQRRLLQDVAAAGFCAVEIDRDGYAGGSDPSAATAGLLGQPIAAAPGEHLAAYDLRALGDSLRQSLGAAALAKRRAEVLAPVVASLSGSLVDIDGERPQQWTGPEATLTISNLGDDPVAVTVSMTVAGNGEVPRTVTVSGPGVTTQVVTAATSSGRPVTFSLPVPPGSTAVTIATSGEVAAVPGTEGRQLASLLVSDLRVTSDDPVNTASLQQFAADSPRSTR